MIDYVTLSHYTNCPLDLCVRLPSDAVCHSYQLLLVWKEKRIPIVNFLLLKQISSMLLESLHVLHTFSSYLEHAPFQASFSNQSAISGLINWSTMYDIIINIIVFNVVHVCMYYVYIYIYIYISTTVNDYSKWGLHGKLNLDRIVRWTVSLCNDPVVVEISKGLKVVKFDQGLWTLLTKKWQRNVISSLD